MLAALAATTAPAACPARAAAPVDPSSVASGRPVWVASDTGKSPINALVDIGDMRQIGDELDVAIRWPYLPPAGGPEQQEQDRVVCGPDHAVSYTISTGVVGTGGAYTVQHTYDAAAERRKAFRYDADMTKAGGGLDSYDTDPRSLACWAAARKCRGEAVTWPPPPDNAALDNSAQALATNAAYNKGFVPTCRLP
ncbi:hypothetical protein [Acidisphaera rubrifaciens]|uniref:hypothetical protein n=1 Tax=Acidisphaera rubrifaciens TaxID=50715 RepID=UPI00130EA284|nr:hypothetical protein [Acidisphaera rubrifaciens]